MIKKSQIETLILCKDRDFKHRSVSFLNNIAFNAEKVAVDSVQEAKSNIEQNPRILNLIIDGSSFFTLLTDQQDALIELCAKPGLMAMLYISEKQKGELKSSNDHGIANLAVCTLPFDKVEFNEVFHNRKGNQSSGGSKPALSGPLAAFATKVKKPGPAAPTPAQAAPKKNLMAYETSQHVRDSIALLGIIENNRKAFDQLSKIGQMFNGIIGTYAYFTNKAACKELLDLALVVEGVCRYYANPEPDQEVSQEHYKLLAESCKISFYILKALREEKEVDPEHIKASQVCTKAYHDDPVLEKRDSVSQDEIDQLLDAKD